MDTTTAEIQRLRVLVAILEGAIDPVPSPPAGVLHEMGESIAKICDAVQMAHAAAVLAERERCAKVADAAADAWDGLAAFARERAMGHEIAAVIRKGA